MGTFIPKHLGGGTRMSTVRSRNRFAALVLIAGVLAAPADTFAQGSPGAPPDPWPRVVDLSDAQVLVYQPQVNAWTDNQLDFRAALAIKPENAKDETFGVIFAAARTQVDKVLRTVTFENLQISKIDFPTLPDHGAGYASELQRRFAQSIRTISLDRLESSLALAGIKPPTVAVQNNPPAIIVSYSPAILVPIDGAPILNVVPSDSRFQRVINTRALILQGGVEQHFYVHVYDGWLESSSISGPWSQSFRRPVGMDGVAQSLTRSGTVDILDGGAKANPKPSLAHGVPTIYTSQVPAELIVFKGQPDFQPVVGTQLLWAANTTSDVLIDISNNNYFVLISGRWFSSAALAGPWTFVANDALPPDFARIPPHSLAGAVLPTVAGTPQAREAAISNSIPQTATVPLTNGPTFTPNFDGAPQYLPIDGTPLTYVANSSEPVIVAANAYYSVVAGVWFTAAQITGPWAIATSVPTAIYTIPPASPLYYVTYVKIYEATPQYVYVGYTPGYLGTVISPYGTVVYGTGYAYTPWIGSVWYPPPYTYGVAAAPVYNPWVGFTFGFAVGLASAAWLEPYWGGSWYSPAYWGHYPCCASASANVYGHWGNAAYSGTRSWYAGGGVAGSSFSGSYATARGATGNINAGRQYNAWTGNASRGYDRTFNTAADGSGNVARGTNYNTYTGQHSTANAVSGTTAGGSTYNRAGATTAGSQGYAHTGGGSAYNANTGKTTAWGSDSTSNNHYADSNGNVYHNDGGGWKQHSSNGWSSAGGDTSWADRESQARSAGDDRFSDFSNSFGHSFGGGSGGWASRFSGGGGGGWGGRFGGGGFRR